MMNHIAGTKRKVKLEKFAEEETATDNLKKLGFIEECLYITRYNYRQ